MIGDGLDRSSSWVLVIFGGVLLALGGLRFVVAVAEGDWSGALFAGALLVFVALGTRRGVRQIRRRRPGPS
jgi:uncharacterized membrane protein